jgi:hypothetical protein
MNTVNDVSCTSQRNEPAKEGGQQGQREEEERQLHKTTLTNNNTTNNSMEQIMCYVCKCDEQHQIGTGVDNIIIIV